jgi:hypothetical protein
MIADGKAGLVIRVAPGGGIERAEPARNSAAANEVAASTRRPSAETVVRDRRARVRRSHQGSLTFGKRDRAALPIGGHRSVSATLAGRTASPNAATERPEAQTSGYTGMKGT